MNVFSTLFLIFSTFLIECIEFGSTSSSLTTLNITTDNVTIYLFTRNNFEEAKILRSSDVSELSNSNFDRTKRNYFVFHGYDADYRTLYYARDSILNVSDNNVFLVDFKGPASSMDYVEECITEVGGIMANYINLMKTTYDLFAENFVLIGGSLGAHVVGQLGMYLNGEIDSIVALDPANMSIGEVFINKSSARYVQTVHTSTVGLLSLVGHADYFADYIISPPGCDDNLTCSHVRALDVYRDSIYLGGYPAVKCDSYESLWSGSCDGNERSHFGSLDLDKKANGFYYFNTTTTNDTFPDVPSIDSTDDDVQNYITTEENEDSSSSKKSINNFLISLIYASVIIFASNY